MIIAKEAIERLLKEALFMNHFVWSPEYLCALFGVDWETTQLKTIVDDLGLKDFKVSTVCGGAIVRTLLKEDLFKGDIDIFPHNEGELELLKAHYGKISSWTKTKHAFTFDYKSGVRATKVQVIAKDRPTSIVPTLKNFDLRHCMFSYYPKDGHIYEIAGASVALSQRKLHLAYVDDPTYTMGRVIKYKRMGFEADKVLEQLVAMSIKGIKKTYFGADGKHLSEGEIDAAIAKASS